MLSTQKRTVLEAFSGTFPILPAPLRPNRDSSGKESLNLVHGFRWLQSITREGVTQQLQKHWLKAHGKGPLWVKKEPGPSAAFTDLHLGACSHRLAHTSQCNMTNCEQRLQTRVWVDTLNSNMTNTLIPKDQYFFSTLESVSNYRILFNLRKICSWLNPQKKYKSLTHFTKYLISQRWARSISKLFL